MFHFRVMEALPAVEGRQRRSSNISGHFNGIEARDVVAGDKVFVLRNESIQAFDAVMFKDLLTREVQALVDAGARTKKGKI